MTMTTPHHPPRSVERSVRLYRSLLVAYPREFRQEFGDDMVQSFRDLMHLSSDRRGVWWRTARDLLGSSARERGSVLMPSGRPSTGALVAMIAAIVAIMVAGPGVFFPLILIPPLVLIGLPAYGITRFRRAWLARRTTGAAGTGQIALGVAAFVPAAAFFARWGSDAGYWVFMSVALTLIAGSALGVIWALVTMITSGRGGTRDRRWKRPLLILIPSLTILGVIIGASYNSYRQSLGPAGDHSVANASADTRALWAAAGAGDVPEVVRLTTNTCADPWVKFPVEEGRHNAKGHAEAHPPVRSDDREAAYVEVSDLLGDYMDDWHDRCPRPTD